MDWRRYFGFGSGPTEIKVDPLSKSPAEAWSKYSKKLKIEKINPESLIHAREPDKYLRFVCISDTHSNIESRPDFVPEGDVLIHAGDFTKCGRLEEVRQFNDFLGTLPHQHKVVIAGNHEISFDAKLLKEPNYLFKPEIERDFKNFQMEAAKTLLTNCTYLEDACIDINGYKIYGSPWQPVFHNWGFNVPRGKEILEKWNLIPDDVDILVTHGPPLGYGDTCISGVRAGCVDLLNTIQKRVMPKFHIFGHIHEAYGIETDNTTTFINASNCTFHYCLSNPAIVFDLPLHNANMPS
ncbi:metallophosphoesterase domain-containing protein 1-like [Argonauta hians]